MPEETGTVTTQDLIDAELFDGMGDEPRLSELKRNEDGSIKWPLELLPTDPDPEDKSESEAPKRKRRGG